MQSTKELMLRSIGAKARRRAAYLATQLIRAASADREEILAAFEFERWLADSCREAFDDCEIGRRPQS